MTKLTGHGPKIRALAAAGRTPEEIAGLFGVDPAAVALVLRSKPGETWREREKLRRPARDRPIRGGLTTRVRTLAAEGWDVDRIAAAYDLDPARVREYLETPVKPRRTPPPPREREIRSRLATRIRELADRDWKTPSIAAALDLDPKRVREFLRRLAPARGEERSRPRTRSEQSAVERSRRKARERARTAAELAAARWVDPWKAAAVLDERYRDPAPVVAPPAPAVDEPTAAVESLEPLDLVVGDEPTSPAPRIGMKRDDWGDRWVRGEAHGRVRLTAEQVLDIRAAHADGRGLKDLAALYEVHRQTVWMIVARRTWTHI